MNTTCARSTDRDSVLAQLLEEYLVSCEAGRPLTADELVQRFPEFAADVRACLASLDFIRHAARAQRSGPTPESMANGPGLSGGPSGTLGDYTLIREIGRGGMGVVYEADQISLGRRVALKVLPFASMLDERALKRFKNEAQAAAVIDHPHIVDIYGVGQDRGVHFYAMRLIEGQTLAEVITQLRGDAVKCDATGNAIAAADSEEPPPADCVPRFDGRRMDALVRPIQQTDEGVHPTEKSPTGNCLSETVARAETTIIQSGHSNIPTGKAFFQFVAQTGIAVAEALNHAHQQGVIHRDIKPSNLMLDSRGKVWITDFGLAHIETNASMTHTGDMLGTLRYMSPEQALTDRGPIDQRTDIYSLGITLYELLTLQPALSGCERPEILRKLGSDAALTPRHLNPAIPVNLETILLKATAKEPQRRYTTAGDLAADLERFLEHKTILARRPTLVDQVMKWSRRHVAGLSVLVVLLMLATIGSTISTMLILRERAEAISQRDNALRQELVVRQREGFLRRYVYAADMKLVWQAWTNAWSDVDVDQVRALLARHEPDFNQDAGSVGSKYFDYLLAVSRRPTDTGYTGSVETNTMLSWVVSRSSGNGLVI